MYAAVLVRWSPVYIGPWTGLEMAGGDDNRNLAAIGICRFVPEAR